MPARPRHRSRGASGWERLWSLEIERRIADVATERVVLIDAAEVHAELRVALRDRHR
jgi:hypothetical protein